MNKLLAVACVMALSAAAAAEDYRAEVGVAYQNISGDYNAVVGTGEFYFNAVSTAERPWAEAAFLQREGGAFALAAVAEYDDFERAVVLEAGAEIYTLNDMLYLSGKVVRYAYDNDFYDDTFTDTAVEVEVGFSPVAGLLVSTVYNSEQDYDFNVAGKYVRPLAGGSALNLEARYAVSEDLDTSFGSIDRDDTYGIGADYYFDPTFSLGVVVDNDFNGTTDVGLPEVSYGVRSTKFFAPAIAASAVLQVYDGEVGASVGALFRF